MNQKSEVRDGMLIDWDVPITMDDGLVLRADVYRPIREGRHIRAAFLRPVRKVPRLRGPVHGPVAADDRAAPGRLGGVHQQVPELGGS